MPLFLIILMFVGMLSLMIDTEETHYFGLGVICTAFLSIVFYSIITANKPTPLDVYRGNTELKITSVNGVPTDTVVVFKQNYYESLYTS